MTPLLRALALCILCVAACVPPAQAQPDAKADAAIRAVLAQQAADWNRGDLAAFASGYKNTPDILFIGPAVTRGYAGMLARYKAHYSSRAAMGTLRFGAIAVQPLDERFATVTGRFHLSRSVAGGGDASGYFLLVMEKTPDGWKIIRDDTAADARPCS